MMLDNADTSAIVGIVAMGAGVGMLWNAYTRRGRRIPMYLRITVGVLTALA